MSQEHIKCPRCGDVFGAPPVDMFEIPPNAPPMPPPKLTVKCPKCGLWMSEPFDYDD
jgi:hypothetical protein